MGSAFLEDVIELFFDHAAVVGGLLVLLIAASLFLLGVFRLPYGSPLDLAKEDSVVKSFLEQHPSTLQEITHFEKDGFIYISDDIFAECSKKYLEPQEFYKIEFIDTKSGEFIRAWVNWEAKKVDCVFGQALNSA